MTTIAWDGKTIAADRLSLDNWGLKGEVGKIHESDDKRFLMIASGELGHPLRWWMEAKKKSIAGVIEEGFPYDKDMSISLALIQRTYEGGSRLYEMSHGVFVEFNRRFFAIGSGRDFAYAAMYLGKTAEEAVRVAMEFDNGTGLGVDVVTI